MNFDLPYDAFLRTLRENTDTDHCFLLGAGASISSGVQPASDCIWEWKRNIFITKNPNLSAQYNEYKSETVQRSIQKWLDNEGVFPAEGAPEEYSFYAQKAFPIDDIRRKYFENKCRGIEPALGYKLLCLMAKFGMVRSVFTTNFDGLVEKAAHQTGITPIAITLDSADRIHRVSSNQELLTIALHGDYKYGPLKNTGEELDNQHDTFVQALEQHLYDKHLIVMGYSGRDKSLMDALKKAYSKPGGGMLFWCGFGYNMADEVGELLMHLSAYNRKGFFIPTEGFDTSLIDISKTCFIGNDTFSNNMKQMLENAEDENAVVASFSMESKTPHVLLKSNLFPITCPTEVFQFEASFSNADVWQEIRPRTEGKPIVAVPIKKMVYALGTQSHIREAFGDILQGEIKRTPITFKEIRDGGSLKNLFLTAIVKSLCELTGLATDDRKKIYLPTTKRLLSKGGMQLELYDAVEVSLFFDNNVNRAKPFGYLCLKPTFYLKSDAEIPKSVRFEVGKGYHETLLSGKPNVKYNEQIDRWKTSIFSSWSRLKFEYPLQSGTGFDFSISSNTMHVSIAKAMGGYPLQLPNTFDNRLILHSGIQYKEPSLEFTDKGTGNIANNFHPMKGLIDGRPYDYSLNGNVFDSEINLGIICPNTHSDALYSFLSRLNRSQSAEAFNPDYLLDYPGFFGAYGVPLNIPDKNSEFWQDSVITTPFSDLMKSAMEFAGKIKKSIDYLASINKKLVLVIFIPTDWNIITDLDEEHEKFDLHDYIKAYAAQKQIGTQFIQESTLADTLLCQVNWWLSLSFYVKAQRTPWVLNGLEANTAFVGIGYSINRQAGKNKVVLGCSHIYNSYGQGLKYRLSKVEDCYFDRKNNPYLSYQEAYKFGALIRELFFNTMGEIPKRVVVHKRTHFRRDEIKGIVDSLKKSGVQQVDLIEINFEEDARFISLSTYNGIMQSANFPLSRGTCFLLNSTSALLWTHGIVPSVKSANRSYYLGGKNIPIPLKVTKHYGNSNISTIANEILGLTKMNWNSFDLYSKLPATIQSSNEIARIGWLLNRFEGKTYDYRNFM
ncbi:SIR2 family protein [Mucilaginibacter sp. Mucisp86]|uniref:SIR2 family protein n=1 Tax=Mucilaginibacter sp. Mucisp86 TaxID=3243060 RepID=UPI0039B42912